MVNPNRTLSTKRYLFAFIITTSIFLIGILLGSYLTTKKVAALRDLQQDLRTQLLSYDLQSSLLTENVCVFNEQETLVEELSTLADRLTAMEEQLGNSNPDVLSLKRYYSLLEIRHWLFLKKLNNVCSARSTFILYFYADDTSCPSCQSQGYILSYLRQKYPLLRVYSFDIRINDPALATLKSLYNITAVPSIVVNEKTYARYLQRDELETILSA